MKKNTTPQSNLTLSMIITVCLTLMILGLYVVALPMGSSGIRLKPKYPSVNKIVGPTNVNPDSDPFIFFEKTESVNNEGKSENSGPSSTVLGQKKDENYKGKTFAAGEILVKLKSRESFSSSFLSRHKLSKKEEIGENISLLKIDDNQSVLGATDELKRDETVEYAEPNYKRWITLVPNDPYYNADIPGYPGTKQWGPQKILAPSAWDVTTGTSGITVAVIDTGVDYSHPELAGRVINGPDYANGDSNPMDDNGHGSHVAGIIAAKGNNAGGIAGISWNSMILAIKALDAGGSGYDSDVASGIIYAADNGAKVINLSLGGPGYSQTLQNAVNYAHGNGVLIVAASGNAGNSLIEYPAGLTNVMGVGSTGKNDVWSSFSNYNSSVDVAAPGESILSLYTTMYANYALDSGTSMATPHVAGLAALIYGLNPSWTPDQVEQRIENTANDFGTAGRDNYYGWGRINAYAALAPYLTVTPNPYDPASGSLSVNFTLTSSANVSLDILDGSWSSVRKIGPLAKPIGANTIIWDGKDDAGQILPAFWYTLALSATNGLNPSRQTILVNLNYGSSLSINSPSATPGSFNPSIGETAALSATISRPTFLGAAIYNDGSQQIRVMPFERRQPGTNSFIWNGRDGDGQIVPAGAYTYIIFGLDSGTNTGSVTGTVNVQ